MWIFQPLGLLLLLILHWVFDFIFQSHEDAENKWNSNRRLLNHTGIYSLCWLPFIFILAGTVANPFLLFFVPITFVLHSIQDYITSREVRKQFKLYNNIHNGFVIIGLDQILHYVQIYLTLKLLLNA